jgi:mono/diheme cytochrome c family protein
VFPPQESAVARGERVAREAGCFACHGPGGSGHRPNPGSTLGEVPGFVDGAPGLYAADDVELREYIALGAPAAKLKSAAYLKERGAALLAMPAYGNRLAPADVDALVAYVDAVAGAGAPESGPAASGHALAVKLGCYGCHGPLGGGGVANPGSLKGYIPAFTGADLPELARDDDELRAWIRTGTVPRLQANPAARTFLERQALHMPGYASHLSPVELESLLALIHALRGEAK